MKAVFLKFFVLNFFLFLSCVSKAQDADSREIFALNNKAKIVLLKIQKEMQALGGEVTPLSNFEKAAVIFSIDDQASFSAVEHSIEFQTGVEMVTIPPHENGELLPMAQTRVLKPDGVIFNLRITDRPGAFSPTWWKEIAVGKKKILILYELKLGPQVAPLNQKINKIIQEIIAKELL